MKNSYGKTRIVQALPSSESPELRHPPYNNSMMMTPTTMRMMMMTMTIKATSRISESNIDRRVDAALLHAPIGCASRPLLSLVIVVEGGKPCCPMRHGQTQRRTQKRTQGRTQRRTHTKIVAVVAVIVLQW